MAKTLKMLQIIPVNMYGQKHFMSSIAHDIIRELGKNTEMWPIIYD